MASSSSAPSTHPFCSPRCRTIDLGKWCSGDYRIAGDPVSDDDLDALASGDSNDRSGALS